MRIMFRVDQAINASIRDQLTWQQQLHCWRAINGSQQPLKLEAVAAKIGVNRSHLSRVLAGERPVAGLVAEFLAEIGV